MLQEKVRVNSPDTETVADATTLAEKPAVPHTGMERRSMLPVFSAASFAASVPETCASASNPR